MSLSLPRGDGGDAALKPGFADLVFDAQTAFRATLDAMSYAGRVHELDVTIDAPAPLQPAMAAIALTLFDFDTPIWLDSSAGNGSVASYLRFHCGAPLVDKTEDARFAVICDTTTMPALDCFAIGEDRYPERSATLILAVPSLTSGPAVRWRGPGIKGAVDVAIAGLPERFWQQWDDNQALYPQGVDILFTCGRQLVGLPRATEVEA